MVKLIPNLLFLILILGIRSSTGQENKKALGKRNFQNEGKDKIFSRDFEANIDAKVPREIGILAIGNNNGLFLYPIPRVRVMNKKAVTKGVMKLTTIKNDPKGIKINNLRLQYHRPPIFDLILNLAK